MGEVEIRLELRGQWCRLAHADRHTDHAPMNTPNPPAHIGMIGLGVMGRNLALNLADHGYTVAAFDVDAAAAKRFIEANPTSAFAPGGAAGGAAGGARGGLVACGTVRALLDAIPPPRIIVALVPAGKAVDAVCQSLIDAGIGADDIVVDGGNSRWTDTIRREKEYRGRLTFFGSGVSGGEVGARFGPSLMPGGDPEAWERLRPFWEAIAAKVDPRTGKPIEGAAPGRPVTGGEPCTAYIGSDGAGHYVKMVHNGIEYADMQLIAEAYHLLRTIGGHEPAAIGEIFRGWNEGDLDSYLIEITADILGQNDPRTGRPVVDVILDAAKMKGTGTWTAVSALELGVPAVTIAEAVFARGMSGMKDERVRASKALAGPSGESLSLIGTGGESGLVEAVRDALYAAKICAYAQGFQLMAAGGAEHGWDLDFASIARIWRGGCIIRARFLDKIAHAFERNRGLANLLLDDHFRGRIDAAQDGWRRIVALAALRGIPAPAFASALAYYDGYRTETLPANLIQAQRDYFGAHTYERVDEPRGRAFHLEWAGDRGEAAGGA